MSRILLTGGSGFVGAFLLRSCLEQGHEVHLLLRKQSRPWRIEKLLTQPRVHTYEDDLLDLNHLTKTVKKIQPEVIFHLAAHGAYSFETDVQQIFQTNIWGTWNLYQATKDIPYRLFVNTGSSSEYGFKSEPMRESDRLEPNSYYAITKAAAAHLGQLLVRDWDKPIVHARLFSVFGPWEDPRRLLPTLLRSLETGTEMKLSRPTIARDYIAVSDVADFYLDIANLSQHPGEIFNVGTGKQTTLQELVPIAEQATGKKLEAHWAGYEPRKWDSDLWVSDMTHTHRLLPWRAKRSVANGIKEMWQWWLEEGKTLPAYQGNQSL